MNLRKKRKKIVLWYACTLLKTSVYILKNISICNLQLRQFSYKFTLELPNISRKFRGL